jgi:DivIVA domain-containing protein
VALSPNEVRSAEFDQERRGYDREQVREFLELAAAALESARNEAMTIERRFRAAAARVQELTAELADRSPGHSESVAGSDRPDDIGRAILIAQRAADATVQEAQREAEQITLEAHRRAQDEYEAERERVLISLRELEGRRVELERRLIERTGELRVDQDRLIQIADSLRGLAERHFDVAVSTEQMPSSEPAAHAAPNGAVGSGPSGLDDSARDEIDPQTGEAVSHLERIAPGDDNADFAAASNAADDDSSLSIVLTNTADGGYGGRVVPEVEPGDEPGDGAR